MRGCGGTRTAESITDLRAWLTTVVSRLSLDRLRSAAKRRETYVGEWLPEPVVTGFDGNDPLAAVVAGEDARFAAMVVLERLNPDQRVAFVLHDGFAVPFGEIAEVLGVSDASARQLASRARRAVASAPPSVADDTHNEVAGALMAALAEGDMEAVVRLLHPEVTLHRRLQPQGADGRAGHPRARTRWRGSCSVLPVATVRGGCRRISWRWSTASSAATPAGHPPATAIRR